MRRKKQTFGKFVWITVLCIVAGASLYYTLYRIWERAQYNKARRSHYTAFGIDVPPGYPIHGLDVSNYQSVVYWPSVKQMSILGIRMGFAFIKATEGLHDKDKQFDRNWRGTKETGIVRGAYHYFLADRSGKAQAENFIKQVKLEPGDLPPVLDIESVRGADPDSLKSRATEWLVTVEAYYKVKPIIYSYAYFYEQNLGRNFDQYPFWVANYLEKVRPSIKRSWILWQHNEAGRIDGISNGVDCNVFNGDSLQWKKLLIQ